MKRATWIPQPTAWATAVALLVFATAVSAAMACIMPILIALMRHWPRLAWFAILVMWLSPIPAAAAIHNVVARFIGVDPSGPSPRPGWFGGVASWWAGFFAWVAIIFVSMTTAFVMLVFNPPPVDDGAVWHGVVSSLAAAVTGGVSGIDRAIIWIILAAYVYELERRSRPS
jgi:hypothetical protein